jgi:hypothetical protein
VIERERQRLTLPFIKTAPFTTGDLQPFIDQSSSQVRGVLIRGVRHEDVLKRRRPKSGERAPLAQPCPRK